jgi:hypothetical protein
MKIGCSISALAWTTAAALAALGGIPPAWAASPVPAGSAPLAIGQPPQAVAPAPAVAPPAAVAGLFPDRADESFVESIEVSVVSIDVVVRDGSGKQATGLTRDDFALFVDGQKVAVTNFYALGNAGAQQPAETPAAGTAAAAAEAGSEPKRERLNLVIYVDNANLHPFDRNRILKQLRSFLQHTLGP